MDKKELEKNVKKAVFRCQEIIQNHPNVIQSESDMERLLSRCISTLIGEDIETVPGQEDYSVHTQISHKINKNGKHKVEERVDILVLIEHLLQQDKKERKEKYSGPSVVCELKYSHIGDAVSLVHKDFLKWENLKNESSMFVIVLLEASNETRFKKKRKRVLEIGKEYLNHRNYRNNKLSCYVLRKIKER